MAPTASAASVYSKLFANRPDTDPFKKPKTKIRKGKHFKKEMKKIRKFKKQKRILNGRLKNESVLLSNLKENYPGILSMEKSSSKADIVFDPTGQTIDREKVDRIIRKLMTKKDVLIEKLTPSKNDGKKVSSKSADGKTKSKSVSNADNSEVSLKSGSERTSKRKLNIDKTKKTPEMSLQTSPSNKRTVVNLSSSSASTKTKNNVAEPSKNAKKIQIPESSSEVLGKTQLQWILGDTSVDKFFSDLWEKAPLLISRKKKTYYKNLITSQLLDQILRDNFIEYTKNIDITSYVDGKRETHNPDGRAIPQVVWDFYQNGCSVRFLNPQTYIKPLQDLNASLQELFGSFVGANTYLTPANSQGFAPHYDDIEAFILQLEGKKAWKVYAPRLAYEHLPRYSSRNFTQEEIGSPILEVTLEPGDLLYLPRGFIHQASTVPNEHSLHVTISVYQKTAWIDLLEKVMNTALQAASASDIEFRRGLPVGFLRQAGLGRPQAKATLDRKAMKKTLRGLVTKLVDYVDLDVGVDEMGKQLMHDALPPVLSPDELQCTVFENGMRITDSGNVVNHTDIQLDTKLRLVRINACRLVDELNEDGQPELSLHYSLDNSLEYHGKDPQFLVLPPESRPVVLALFSAYPKYASMQELVYGRVKEEDREECVQVLRDLWERGLLITSEPLRPSS